MNAKTVFSAALLMTAIGFGSARGQTPPMMKSMETAPPPNNTGLPITNGMPAPAPGQIGHLSSWITGDKYDCCPAGCGSGPIQTEFFFRTGPSIVAGNGTIADVLQTGLYLGAGGKTLFWDTSMCSAWTVELGIANISNHAHAPENYPGIPLSIFVPQDPKNPVTAPDASGNLPPQRMNFGKNGVPGVTLRELNRTFFDVGGGREWYLWGSACSGGTTWRVGADAGGRWGSASADFNEIRHRTDVIGGFWAAAHTDVEIPCGGCCIFQAGCRLEYGYTWSDILQIQNKSDVQDVSILFSVGIRF